ncbi:alkylation response protein AidB-like acyl-CoA dehydrogenase [Actinomadura algeriensis]|uniref:Alkylation response protein AidB-like acyl-CoA dehydrogenase n=1 Tax=Actinomadura algeriensis TaxID=1679523 RepID=A0ABR9K2E0_9ACTN|nr:alkylation response protein AidB-like acyl-CoA dehydrogenase [Actinomadura algeriensis]
MTTGFGAEAEEFAASVAGVVESGWGTAVAAPAGDLPTLAEAAVAQGWYEPGGEGALDFLAAAVRELGARACPLPIADAYVTARLADDATRARVASGEVRPLVAVAPRPDGTVFEHLDAAEGATHVLRLVPGAAAAELLPIERTDPAPGLAVPAWSRVTVTTEGALTCGRGAEDVAAALSVHRLGLAIRALGAAARVHALAVEHAKVRRQFGRAIGAFGAVQQRVAACQIDLAAGERLVEDAVGHVLAGGPDAGLAAELAIRFVRDTAPSIMFGAQHTLGAIGYFEEHEAPWLFRRVHADLSRLETLRAPGVDRALVEDGRSLPASNLGPVAEAFREEVRALLAAHRRDGGHDAEGLRAEMAGRGLFALAWPRAEGGREATVEEQVVLNEEMKYARGPVDRAMSAAMLLGHSILRHGTPEQKAEFLPLIREGRMAFCLGYSEPEAGSDLASLRTAAVRDGDHWVVNGQKSWTTRGQTASHVWLAVRTDPDARPRHAGITIFLVPMDTPGIQIQRHVALSGEISCTVFYDDVRIPDSMRVGEVNGGWKVIGDALAAERVIMGGVAATLLRQLDDLLDVLRRDPAGTLGPDGSRPRARLASLAARLQAARVLVLAATRSMNDAAASGARVRLAAPMAAVLSGELAEDFGQGMLEILGPAAALGPDAPGAAGAGLFEHGLRLAPMFVIGGGTNDVQRGIIARALGLPRE